MNKILLSLVLTLSFAACNGGVTNTESEDDSQAEALGQCDYLDCTGGSQSCGELGGDYCYNGGGKPRGYDSLGRSNDCRECLQRGPSCGELGGNECLQHELRYATNGQELLGRTYDCESCVYQH